MTRIFQGLLCSLIALLLAVGLTSPASALEAGDIGIQVKPSEQEIELLPGETFQGTIDVKNIGRLEFTFTLSMRPYQVKNDAYDPDFSTENDYTELANWVTFPQSEYRIEPGVEITVPFTVTVPDDVPGGGQYAAIIVETRDSIDESATFRTVSQLAALLYAHVEGEEHVGGVLMAHSMPRFLLGSPFTVSETVKNDGNVDFHVNHTLTIYNFFTNAEVLTPTSVDEQNKTPGYASPIVLPATSRTNTLTWEGAPQLGVFRAIQTISFLDQSYTYESVVILCPIWLAAAVGLLIATMIIWLIIRIRNRRRQRKSTGVV